MAKKNDAGKKSLRAIFFDAAEKLQENNKQKQIFAPPTEARRLGGKLCAPGRWPGAPDQSLPENCPFKVVGRDSAGSIFLITYTGHLRQIEPAKLTENIIVDISAPATNEVLFAWPAWSKEKRVKNAQGETVTQPAEVVRMEAKSCARAIINAAARQPEFDLLKQYRGRGGWADKDGNFIWHSGKFLWRKVGNKLQRATPEAYAGFLYARENPLVEPWREEIEPEGEKSPAMTLFRELQSWKWARPEIDPLLILGWIITALMGGALAARPIIFTTGGAGVGKSTLHMLLREVFNGAALSSVDATAAGIYQQIKQDSLPVIVDELESRAGNNRSQSVVELARLAFTGGTIYRGGADNSGVTFALHCSFFFSAINPPHMGEQDRSRMAILNLDRLESEAVGRVSLSNERLAVIGRQLLRLVMDGFKKFNESLLPDIKKILKNKGFDARAIDTFGTLLAAGRLALGEEGFAAAGFEIDDAEKFGNFVARLTVSDREEKIDNWHACLSHLLQSSPESWHSGEKPSIGTLINRFLTPGESAITLQALRDRLAIGNLGFRQDVQGKVVKNYLAVPRAGGELKKIYAGEIWQDGVWWTALKQAPANIVIANLGNKQKVRINGEAKHCLLIDMAAYYAFVNK